MHDLLAVPLSSSSSSSSSSRAAAAVEASRMVWQLLQNAGSSRARTIHALHSILSVPWVFKLNKGKTGGLPRHPYAPYLSPAAKLQHKKQVFAVEAD